MLFAASFLSSQLRSDALKPSLSRLLFRGYIFELQTQFLQNIWRCVVRMIWISRSRIALLNPE
jgi:hypothetical protein